MCIKAKQRANKLENKLLISNRFKGIKNHKCSVIYIFDNKFKLIYVVKESIKDFCKKHNLPGPSIAKSYKNNSEPLFKDSRPADISRLRNNGMLKYKDWFALR